MKRGSIPLMIRVWSFLASPSLEGSGPPPSALGESLAAADTAASRILEAPVINFNFIAVCNFSAKDQEATCCSSGFYEGRGISFQAIQRLFL